MYEIEERVDVLEDRTSRVEKALENFINHTNFIMARLEREMKKFKDKTVEFEERAERDRREMNKKWGELANKMDTIVEDIIFPATRSAIKKCFKCSPSFLGIRIQRRKDDLRDEFDIIAICDDKVFLIEIKSTLRPYYFDKLKFRVNED